MILKEGFESLLHPILLSKLKHVQQLAMEYEDCVNNNLMPEDFISRRYEALEGLVVKEFDGVYRLPYLSLPACELLLGQSSQWDYSPNEDEDEPYQMNEVVLKNELPKVYDALKALYEDALVPVWMLITGCMATEVTSIQMAKYLPDSMPSTGWHFDEDSECTSVVELTPDPESTGASLNVFPDINLGIAQQGWVTLFNGRTVLHSTVPVVKERKILVHWANREAEG